MPDLLSCGYRLVKEFPTAPGGRRSVGIVADGFARKWVLKTFERRSGIGEDPAKELALLQACAGPYVVKVHDSFEDRGELCLVMEHAEGGELAARIEQARVRQEPFSDMQVLRWFSQAGSALEHIHSRLVLHRDFTSRNLLLTSEGNIRLCDFGVSKQLRSATDMSVTVVGTPSYLSPEMCEEQPYTLKSDVWALACVLFELVALHHPFTATNIMDMMEMITERPLPTLPASSSASLKRLCNALLVRNPDRRPTAAEAVQQVERERLQAQEIAELMQPSLSRKELSLMQPSLSRKEFSLMGRTPTVSTQAPGSRPGTATTNAPTTPGRTTCSRRTPFRIAGEASLRLGLGVRP